MVIVYQIVHAWSTHVARLFYAGFCVDTEDIRRIDQILHMSAFVCPKIKNCTHLVHGPLSML